LLVGASGSVSQIAGLHHLQMYFDPGVSDFVGKSQESLIGLHRVIFAGWGDDGFSSG